MQTNTVWRAYVINLDRAKERWSRIHRQLLDLGVPHTRVEAIDGNDMALPAPHVHALQFQVMHGRRLHGAEIGCYFSHLLAMEQFLATEEDYCLILEDDAVLSPNIKSVIDAAIELGDDWDILRLGSVNTGRWLAVADLTADATLGVGFTRLKGAAAYMVNRKAARVLRERLVPMRLPYDIVYDLEFFMGLKALGVEPRPTVQDKSLETQIQHTVWTRKFPPWRYLIVFPVRAGFEFARVVCRAGLYVKLRVKHGMRGRAPAMERSR